MMHGPIYITLDSFVGNEKKWNLDSCRVAASNISTDVLNFTSNFEMSDFRHDVVEVFDFVGYCAA